MSVEKSFSLRFGLIGLALTLTACGKPFRVPQTGWPDSGHLSDETTVRGLTIHATALTDEDELMDRFGANMMLARLLVVKLRLRNHGQEAVSFHQLRYLLAHPGGQRFEFLPPEKALDQLYKYYQIKNYQIKARKELEAEYETRALHTEYELGSGEERQGVLFFKIPETVDPLEPLPDLTLRLERVQFSQSSETPAIELQLRR